MQTAQKVNFKGPRRRYVIILFGNEIDQICLCLPLADKCCVLGVHSSVCSFEGRPVWMGRICCILFIESLPYVTF